MPWKTINRASKTKPAKHQTKTMENNLRKISMPVFITIFFTAIISIFSAGNPALSGLLAGFALCLSGVLINIIIFERAIFLFRSPFLYIPFLLFKIAIAGIIILTVMTRGAYPHFIAAGIILGIIYSYIIVNKSCAEGRCRYGSR